MRFRRGFRGRSFGRRGRRVIRRRRGGMRGRSARIRIGYRM